MSTDVQIADLVPNAWYWFTHARKGRFRGKFIELDFTVADTGVDPATQLPQYDPAAIEAYVVVDIYTAPGSGAEHLARAKAVDPATGKKTCEPEFTGCKLLAKLLSEITPLVP